MGRPGCRSAAGTLVVVKITERQRQEQERLQLQFTQNDLFYNSICKRKLKEHRKHRKAALGRYSLRDFVIAALAIVFAMAVVGSLMFIVMRMTRLSSNPLSMEDRVVIDKLTSWVAAAKANRTPLQYVMGVDIGATNTRVALQRVGDSEVVIVKKIQADRVSTLISQLETVSAWLLPLVRGIGPLTSCMDAAGPISPNRKQVEITNWPDKTDRTLNVDTMNQKMFPPGKTLLLNDLEACCYGILGLNAAGTLGNFFAPLWGPNMDTLQPFHYLVLAMGTGLGVGLLLRIGNEFKVVPAEIGHTLVTSFGPTHPEHATDTALTEWLSTKLYMGRHGIEFEDICSGRGLEWAYEWVITSHNATGLETRLPAAAIAERGSAETPCLYAREALWLHYKYLFRVAQNTCVGVQTKGVILAGDNQVNNHKFVRSNVAQLQEQFLTHPKKGWLSGIPVVQQETKINVNLVGALYMAQQHSH
ncbi:Glucokinase 1 [Pelomyxa schiedti]|nr:Glucokinase 1 [Pelomyxa schiedti]